MMLGLFMLFGAIIGIFFTALMLKKKKMDVGDFILVSIIGLIVGVVIFIPVWCGSGSYSVQKLPVQEIIVSDYNATVRYDDNYKTFDGYSTCKFLSENSDQDSLEFRIHTNMFGKQVGKKLMCHILELKNKNR